MAVAWRARAVHQAALFVLSGVLGTLFTQQLVYAGLGDARTMLLVLPTYVGYLLVALLLPPSSAASPSAAAALASLDAAAAVIALPSASSSSSSSSSLSSSSSSSARSLVAEVSGSSTSVPSSASSALAPHSAAGVGKPAALPFPATSGAAATIATAAATADAQQAHDLQQQQQLQQSPPPPAPVCAPELPLRWKLGTAVLELVTNAAHVVALRTSGSGLHIVVFSSVTAWSALLSRRFLRKHISAPQWIGIIIVLAGLAVGTLGGASAGSAATASLQWRVTVSLVATLLSAMCYVANEHCVSQCDARRLCVFHGVVLTSALLVYVALYTLPRADELVAAPMAAAAGQRDAALPGAAALLVLVALLVLTHFVHAWTYFELLASAGAVATGLTQGVRAVSVFFLSAWLHCGTHPEQCITAFKVLSAFVVVAGVLVYSGVVRVPVSVLRAYASVARAVDAAARLLPSVDAAAAATAAMLPVSVTVQPPPAPAPTPPQPPSSSSSSSSMMVTVHAPASAPQSFAPSPPPPPPPPPQSPPLAQSVSLAAGGAQAHQLLGGDDAARGTTARTSAYSASSLTTLSGSPSPSPLIATDEGGVRRSRSSASLGLGVVVR